MVYIFKLLYKSRNNNQHCFRIMWLACGEVLGVAPDSITEKDFKPEIICRPEMENVKEIFVGGGVVKYV